MTTFSRRSKSRPRTVRSAPRILTVVPICDGHDSPIVTINFEFARHGIEVIYLGYHRSVRDVVRAAIQEDVEAIGISSYNGGHIEFFSQVLRMLRNEGATDIGVFGGGGGTITLPDVRLLKRRGVDEIFFAGTSLEKMVEFVQRTYSRPQGAWERGSVRGIARANLDGPLNDLELGKLLTAAEVGSKHSPLDSQLLAAPERSGGGSTTVIGITGPGGAGKTTLIDELALRFLNSQPRGRLAILSHDPSLAAKGALLGDRAGMVNAQHDRVFMRSIGTRGKAGGLAAATRRSVEILKHGGFGLIMVESAGIGQEDLPFARGLVDKQVLIMSPDYGSRLQLQKIVMLETADVVVVNKADLPGGRTAYSELEQRLASNKPRPKLIATVAKRHRDPGVDELFKEVVS
jgi:methylmalonyl-CoA mutase